MRLFLSMSVALLTTLLLSSLFVGRARAQDASLLDVLPTAADIGATFGAIEDRPRSLEEQATGFSDAAQAARLLAGWGWQENALQRFASDTETVDISATRFANADGAAQALPFFLDDRAAILGQQESQSIVAIGDEARAVNGFYNGLYDYTLYVRSGPLLLRISAASESGSPRSSPEAIAQGIIDRAAGVFGEASAPAEATAQQSANVVLPESLPLSGIACVPMENSADVLAQMEQYDGIANASSTLPAMGWLEGAGREFGCDAPSAGHVGWVSLSVHRFNDPGAAEGAVYSFADSRSLVTNLAFASPLALGDSAAALSGPTVNGTEYTLFLSRGDLVFRVTGVSPNGNPQSDVESIAANLYAQNTGETPTIVTAPTVAPAPTQAPMIAAPTIAPAALVPVPTLTPVPTLAPLPTSTPLPTVAPLPTATPRPAIVAPPTSTPAPAAPAAPAAPTTIAVQIPTAIPTASSSGGPTPTPRVINPPTPVGQ